TRYEPPEAPSIDPITQIRDLVISGEAGNAVLLRCKVELGFATRAKERATAASSPRPSRASTRGQSSRYESRRTGAHVSLRCELAVSEPGWKEPRDAYT